MEMVNEAETKSEAWELARELVRIDSSDPGAYEKEIGEFVYGWLRGRILEAGLEADERDEAGVGAESRPESACGGVAGNCKDADESAESGAGRGAEGQACRGAVAAVDRKTGKILLCRREALPGRYNVMARIPGEKPGPALTFICHMDTVMLGDGWDEARPALGAVTENGRLYGRGACDMKSGLACALTAFSGILKKVGQGMRPVRPLVFIGTVDEEDFMRGVEAAIRWGWATKQDWYLDTEPTDGQIQVAHKGRLWFELTMEGITAHASNPWKGADAIAAMAEAVSLIRRRIKDCPAHHDLGISTVTFGQIEGGYRPYVVPDRCRVWIDMRLVPPTDTAAAKRIMDEAVRTAEAEIPGVKGSYVVTGDRPYVEKDDQSPLLSALRRAALEVTGQEAEVGSFNGYTDTAVIAGTLGNKNCMSYGPGSLELAHKPNESVPFEDVRRCGKVLGRLAEDVVFGN